MTAKVLVGDCREVLLTLEANSIDACVTDPPYGLEFMGKEWDKLSDDPVSRSWDTKGRTMTDAPKSAQEVTLYKKPNPRCDNCGRAIDGRDTAKGFKVCHCEQPAPRLPNTYALKMQAWHETWAREVYRVLKPGAHLLAFSGTRTSHRMVCAIEDAGFEIRDCLMWLYGSGFPKSLDVSKAMDATLLRGGSSTRQLKQTNEQDREEIGQRFEPDRNNGFKREYDDIKRVPITAPATDLARQWDGWGTALKPAYEIIVKAQKPWLLSDVLGILALKIKELLCQSKLLARDAVRFLPSNQNASNEASDSALWSAVEQSSTPDDLFALTAMWRCESETPSSLSIAWSWLNILAALWIHESTFTTETASSLTTDLKTLKSLLSTTTAKSIVEELTGPNGGGSNAWLVERFFNVVWEKLLLTLAVSAHAPAISTDENAALRPNYEPIILARKPLAGTVATNVTQYGTGALNIDGCRIGTSKDVPASGSASRHEGWGDGFKAERNGTSGFDPNIGRWPANLLLDEWDEQVLRLRYNIPNDVSRLIGEFFSDYRRLPALPAIHSDLSEQTGSNEVLFSGVLRESPEPTDERLVASDVRQTSFGSVTGADEQTETSDRQTGSRGAELEGRSPYLTRLRADQYSHADARGAGTVPVDGETEQQSRNTGTSARDGASSWAATSGVGNRASHQRREVRQPAREFGNQRSQRPQERALGSPDGTAPTTRDERTPLAPPLFILECDIPRGWLAYFEPTGISVQSPDCSARLLDAMSGERGGGAASGYNWESSNNGNPSHVIANIKSGVHFGDTGGASRFFYTAKASRAERNKGLAGMPEQQRPGAFDDDAYEWKQTNGHVVAKPSANHHPTVKPVDLMQWLVRLITPKGGTVLDPFTGSGSTGIAADREGFDFIGIEQDAEYAEIARKRIVGDCPLFTTLAAD